MRRRIALDIDGCLADFNGPMWTLLTEAGAPMRPFEGDDPETWYWYPRYGATDDHIEVANARQTTLWWATLPRHRDFTYAALRSLQALCETQEVTFVTARPHSRNETADWLWGRGIRQGHGQPHVFLTPQTKVPALVAMAPDAIVEDNLATLISYAQVLRPVRANPRLYLVDRAYNQHGDSPDITRVPSMEHALHLIQEWA